MTESVSSSEAVTPLLEVVAEEPCTLHVCTSCRPSGAPRDPMADRPGFILFKELRDAIARSPLKERVSVKPTECLSICPRPCGIALSQPGAWTYLFGDQEPTKAARDIIDCVSLYLERPDGFMARNERPKTMRGSILGRVPPSKGAARCT